MGQFNPAAIPNVNKVSNNISSNQFSGKKSKYDTRQRHSSRK